MDQNIPSVHSSVHHPSTQFIPAVTGKQVGIQWNAVRLEMMQTKMKKLICKPQIIALNFPSDFLFLQQTSSVT